MVSEYKLFSHQRLDVYAVALEFVAWQRDAGASGSLKNQLERASESVVLNIAEGASQQSNAMAKKHYRIALASAAECSAAIDLLVARKGQAGEGQRLIWRVGKMLKRLAR